MKGFGGVAFRAQYGTVAKGIMVFRAMRINIRDWYYGAGPFQGAFGRICTYVKHLARSWAQAAVPYVLRCF